MPDVTLSEALKEAYASVPRLIVYDTLEFTHPLNTPVRVVRGYRNINATLEATAPYNPGETVTFTAFPFELERPEVGPGAVPELTIEIDNASLEIEDFVNRALASLTPITVLYRAYVQGDLGAPANSPVLQFDVFSISASNLRVSAKARIGDYSNARFPKLTYNARDWPGLP